MSDAYSEERRDEHSTLGDAAERFHRDEDAFTAGVQYALDRIMSNTRDLLGIYGVGKYVRNVATDILASVHRGEL